MTTLDAAEQLKFGIFLAPFHPVGQNPTLALERCGVSAEGPRACRR